ncbi:MAG: hypothetical protein ABIR16_08000 [Dokdonella sp.]
MNTVKSLTFGVAISLLCGACSPNPDTPAPAPPVESDAAPISEQPATAPPATDSGAASATDQWLGTWAGPEGTFLKLDGGNGIYQVTIQDLDGPKTWEGHVEDGRIRFERNGVSESIHAGNGEETGMKWFADEKNCLIVRSGEGFCRN